MKTKSVFSCQTCGYQSAKWLGRCPDCSAWNSFAEETFSQPQAQGESRLLRAALSADAKPVLLKEVKQADDIRVKTGISELDRVLGGGVVKGGVSLLGGDPGIGKSTIALQISHQLARAGQKVLYISAEESVQQTKLRAERLGADKTENIYVVNQTDLSIIIEYIKKIKPDTVIIDSIQVIFNPQIPSSPGSVSQVRECSNILAQTAKGLGVSMFIIGHVTKEGSIAGPRVLEHIVDTVLYFEGQRNSAYRILRAMKNRFGSTNEIGVFQMGALGLEEVANPSQVFLSERTKDGSPGSVIASVMEGTRPMLLEIQALVSRSFFGYPSRKSEGFDANRLNLIIAVLEKRIGLHLENEDVFVNAAGGVSVDDPACDLAVAAAVASNLKEKPAKKDTVVIGEIGLSAEVRSVHQITLRIQEAQRLGFKQCIIPKNNFEPGIKAKIELIPAANISEAFEALFN
ncbi:MAG TPA: DNA repair protein RadA [Candidatus Omnitrophota bacterium]|nr:DNA repair protein RadA [Candidatus Omnitrophota bacterium]